jgi:hypothetical protein
VAPTADSELSSVLAGEPAGDPKAVSALSAGLLAKAPGPCAARIAHDEIDPVAVANPFERDRPAAVLERVGDQVVESLRDAEWIDVRHGVAATPADRDPPTRVRCAHAPALAGGDRKHSRFNGPAAEIDAPAVDLAIEVAKGGEREFERVGAVRTRRPGSERQRLERPSQLVETLVERAAPPALDHAAAHNDERH